MTKQPARIKSRFYYYCGPMITKNYDCVKRDVSIMFHKSDKDD